MKLGVAEFTVTVADSQGDAAIKQAHDLRAAIRTMKYAVAELKTKYDAADIMGQKKTKQLEAAMQILEPNVISCAEMIESAVSSS